MYQRNSSAPQPDLLAASIRVRQMPVSAGSAKNLAAPLAKKKSKESVDKTRGRKPTIKPKRAPHLLHCLTKSSSAEAAPPTKPQSSKTPKPKTKQVKQDIAKLTASSFTKMLQGLERPQQFKADEVAKTMEAIDVSSKQLEDLKTYFKLKLAAVTKKEAKEEEKEKRDVFKPTPSIDAVRKKLEALQKTYADRPRIRYKSVKEIRVTKKKYMQYNNLDTIEESDDDDSDEQQQPIVDLYQAPSVMLSDASVLEMTPADGSAPASAPASAKKPPVKEFHVAASRCEGPSGDELNASGKRSLYEVVFGNTKLEESLLKSEFLLKEFRIDPRYKFLQVMDKDEAAVDEKSVRLFESAVNKLKETGRERAAGRRSGGNGGKESSRRDQKLYETLNMALKNSLFTAVRD